MVNKLILALALFFSLSLPAFGGNLPIKVGYGGGYLSAVVYAARSELGARVDIRQFRSLSDVAYALLLGSLDTGFVEAEKLAFLATLDGFDRLAVVGKITYPYGSTLVLRKGLNNRLQELGGLTVAASAPNCALLEEFTKDARRLGADISDVNYVYMPFNAMVPALVAGVADAAVIRGSYSVTALQEGHNILYQNWEVEPGDECCPAVIDQAALVLLTRRDRFYKVAPFTEALVAVQQKLSPDQLRRAVADNTVIPFEILQGQPVPE